LKKKISEGYHSQRQTTDGKKGGIRSACSSISLERNHLLNEIINILVHEINYIYKMLKKSNRKSVMGANLFKIGGFGVTSRSVLYLDLEVQCIAQDLLGWMWSPLPPWGVGVSPGKNVEILHAKLCI